MNQNGTRRSFQMTFWGSKTKAPIEKTVNVERIMPRRSRTQKATISAMAASTMTQRSPAAPPPDVNQPSVVKIECSVLTGSFVYPIEFVYFWVVTNDVSHHADRPTEIRPATIAKRSGRA